MLKEVEEAVRESEQALPAATVSCVYCVSRGKIHRRQSLDLLTAPMPMPISIHICASQRTAPMHPRSQHLPHADAWASVLAATPTPLFFLLSHRCMRLSSCGQVWKRGAKKRKLQKDEHASARVEAGISHRPTPLGVGAPRAKLQANGAQGLPPKRIERGVCSMVKCPARVLGSARVASCRPELPPPLGTPAVAHPQPLPLPWAPVS